MSFVLCKNGPCISFDLIYLFWKWRSQALFIISMGASPLRHVPLPFLLPLTYLSPFHGQYHSSDWLQSPPPKWPILCRVGRWTLLQPTHPLFMPCLPQSGPSYRLQYHPGCQWECCYLTQRCQCRSANETHVPFVRLCWHQWASYTSYGQLDSTSCGFSFCWHALLQDF